MSSASRDAAALAGLLRLAKAKADEANRRLNHLRLARTSAEKSIERLCAELAREESKTTGDDPESLRRLGGFRAGIEQKRSALAATARQLDAEIAAGEIEFAELAVEIRKFDYLIEQRRAAGRAVDARRDAGRVDEAAVTRFNRRGGL